MNVNKSVSVIVPIYNVEQYLDRCIKSIVEQDYKQLEIILIDDGSKDSSGNLADRWTQKDSRIRVIHQSNSGLSAARNHGISIAKGEFILFVDSDDWIHKHMISALMSKIYEADLVCCGMFTASEKQILPMNWFKQEKVLSTPNALDYLIDNTILTSHITKFLYPKKVFENIKFPEGKLFEDIRTLHKIFLAVNTIYILPEAYYYYYIRTNSITNTVSLKSKVEWFNALKERCEDLKEFKEEYQQKICSQMAVVISLAIVQNDFTCQEKEQYRDELISIKKFLNDKVTCNAVRHYATKNQYLYYKLARFFWFNANKGYSIVKRSLCLIKKNSMKQ